MSFSVIDEIVSGTKKKKKTSYKTMEAPGNGPGSTREQREGLKPFQLISREVCTNTSTGSEKERESRTSLLERWWIRRRSCTSVWRTRNLPQQLPLLLAGVLIISVPSHWTKLEKYSVFTGTLVDK